MKALILVDIQNDFLAGGALAVPEGNRVIAVANRLSPRFDFVVATQDWHPADHESFATCHPGKQVGELIDLHGLTQVLWPVHCVERSRGAAFPLSLDLQHVDAIVQKGTDRQIDSYSGFWDNGRRKETGLRKLLQEKSVDEVYVMGLATDYCVRFTALDSVNIGWKTYLISDGCRGVNLKPNDSADAIAEMKSQGVEVISSSELP